MHQFGCGPQQVMGEGPALGMHNIEAAVPMPNPNPNPNPYPYPYTNPYPNWKAVAYDWSQPSSAQGIPTDNDLIIFSECLYFEELFAMLHSALLEVVPVGGLVLFSYRLRIPRRERPYFEALERNFDLKVMPAVDIAQIKPAGPVHTQEHGKKEETHTAVHHGPSSGDRRNTIGAFVCLARRRPA